MKSLKWERDVHGWSRIVVTPAKRFIHLSPPGRVRKAAKKGHVYHVTGSLSSQLRWWEPWQRGFNQGTIEEEERAKMSQSEIDEWKENRWREEVEVWKALDFLEGKFGGEDPGGTFSRLLD